MCFIKKQRAITSSKFKKKKTIVQNYIILYNTVVIYMIMLHKN